MYNSTKILKMIHFMTTILIFTIFNSTSSQTNLNTESIQNSWESIQTCYRNVFLFSQPITITIKTTSNHWIIPNTTYSIDLVEVITKTKWLRKMTGKCEQAWIIWPQKIARQVKYGPLDWNTVASAEYKSSTLFSIWVTCCEVKLLKSVRSKKRRTHWARCDENTDQRVSL